jgi:xanthine/uracil permease
VQRLSWLQITLGGFQWLLFMFTNTVVIPLSVGTAFHQPTDTISASLQRSFVYTGIACILQAYWGHKLPLMEGQSGLWWGVILSLCASVPASGGSLSDLGGSLSIGIMIAGIIIAILGVMGFGSFLNRLFTPVVMSVFLFLLASQLIITFFKAMIGLSDGNVMNPQIALLSCGLVMLVLILNVFGSRMLSNFAILIGILIGWSLYALMFPRHAVPHPDSFQLFQMFPLGMPHWDFGIIATAVFTGLINTTNTIASFRGAELLYDQKMEGNQFRRSFFITGINSILSGIFGMVPYAPYTSSIGFLRSTRILERTPFVIGACLFFCLGMVPQLGALFSTLPVSVGSAVLFVAYLQLFGAALQNLDGIRFTYQTIYRVALPTLLGIAILNLSPSVFASLPAHIRPILSNGLLMGIFLSIILEHAINWERIK